MIDQTNELSPTIKALDKKRDIENLSGSPLMKRKNLFGKEFSFYDDGSILVVDPSQQEYHFLTREGREKGRELRRSVEDIVKNDQRLSQMKMLGEGKGGFSKVYELETPTGAIAVKATDKVGMLLRDLEGNSDSQIPPSLRTLLEGRSNRITVQRKSLADTMKFFKKLDEAGIRQPESYGFSVKRDPNDDGIQEFQFMERIDRPTVLSIFESAADARDITSGEFDVSKLPYPDLLRQIAIKHYSGNTRDMLRAIKSSYDDFVRGVKEAVPYISDLEMDNIFLIGYNETDKELEFMLIDPIEEHVYIRPIQNRPDLINYKHDPLENINPPNNISMPMKNNVTVRVIESTLNIQKRKEK